MNVYDVGVCSKLSEIVSDDEFNFSSLNNAVKGVTEHEIIKAISITEHIKDYDFNDVSLDDFVSNITSSNKTFVVDCMQDKKFISALNVDSPNMKYVLYGNHNLYVIFDNSDLTLDTYYLDDYAKFVKSPFFATA
jgi:hypothetical protein